MGVQSRLFGTDGIRGRANEGPLTPEMAVAFGRAVAAKFGSAGGPLVIGRDTRISGPMLEHAVASGVAAMGVDVVLAGVVPTPAVAFLTRHLKGCAGVVISASHNPFEDNGLKIFKGDGMKCDDALELEIEALILGDALRKQGAVEGKIGRIEVWTDGATRYADLAVKAYGEGLDLRGVRVVVDAGNGAAYGTTPLVLSELGAEVLAMNIEPDGVNINAKCGSTYPELIQQTTRDFGAQIGLSHDGDADRLICCDETGSLLDGDEMLAVIGLDLLKRGKLAKKTLVATVMSNLGLDECFAAAGGKILPRRRGRSLCAGADAGARPECRRRAIGACDFARFQHDWRRAGDGAGVVADHPDDGQAAKRIAIGDEEVSAAFGKPEGA